MSVQRSASLKERLRWVAFTFLTIGCFGGFAYLFYQNDWLQTQQRERPTGYPTVPEHVADSSKASVTLYHFYSPECACSRFVLVEVERIARTYQGRLRIVAITAEPDGDTDDYPFTSLLDTSETIARQLGVYCTPQAVITGPDGKVLYAGSYNRARFCAEARTAYVDQALGQIFAGHIVQNKKGPIFGCLLPSVAGN